MIDAVIKPIDRVPETLRVTIESLLAAGDAAEARRLMADATAVNEQRFQEENWARLQDANLWPDAWLIAAIRCEPPDGPALDVLVDRYWKKLFARCQVMTLNAQKASDLAQEAWCRVLRARRSLKPDGNFPAYLLTIATNLWRDNCRSARRAGPMAESRLASLEAEIASDTGENGRLADFLPDLKTIHHVESTLLKLDIDEALGRLNTLLHEILVARYIAGESCAEIGLRYGRTEQTISAWVREGVRQMKIHLEDSRPDDNETVAT
jgi:RNA polymerase sigma factor (sigma-70 family)